MSEITDAGKRSNCVTCSTELAHDALACPSCHTLVYATSLKSLAATAQERAAAGDLIEERRAWTRALGLLPRDTAQHGEISARVATLDQSIAHADSAPATPAKAPVSGPWWKRRAASVGAIILVALGKLKFLLLGLTKLSTIGSMFAFFGVYWTAFGWPLALGFVISIYIHEMGHVAMLKRLGIDAGAPFFIPGLGALVLLKQHVSDPVTDAKIGLAGPVWGLGAGAAAYAVGLATASPIWFAIAHLTGYLNLFNLIPVWQLDGSRGFHALGREARWAIVAASAVLAVVTGQPLLWIIAAVAAFRALQPANARTHMPTLATFAALLVSLSFLSSIATRK